MPELEKMTKLEERRIASDVWRKKVIDIQTQLFTAQASLALGTQFLYRVDKREDSTGKEIRSRPVLVTDQYEIEDYISKRFDPSTSEYYFIATDKPDGRAIDSLLDRALGKPTSQEEDEQEATQLGVIAYPVTDGQMLAGDGMPLLVETTTQGVTLDTSPLEASASAEGGEGV